MYVLCSFKDQDNAFGVQSMSKVVLVNGSHMVSAVRTMCIHVSMFPIHTFV